MLKNIKRCIIGKLECLPGDCYIYYMGNIGRVSEQSMQKLKAENITHLIYAQTQIYYITLKSWLRY